jgi:hypothetical protein
MDGWMDEWVGGWKDGPTDRRMDGPITEGSDQLKACYASFLFQDNGDFHFDYLIIS